MRGLAKHLALLAAHLFSVGKSSEGAKHQTHANTLLVNGYNAPYPYKVLNQRQKRKIKRQTNNY